MGEHAGHGSYAPQVQEVCNPIAHYETGTGAHTLIREPNGTPVAIRIGGVSSYYIADRQGSTIAIVSSAGVKRNSYSYDPYGASRTKNEQVTNPYQYIGGQLDAATGLYHLQNRYYDASIGRFTQPDPSGSEENAYLYAAGNPINYVDPLGLSASQLAGANVSTSGTVTGQVTRGCALAYGGQVLATGALLGATVGSGGALAVAGGFYLY